MAFDSTAYGAAVASILALDGAGERVMPLASGECSSPAALTKLERADPKQLFPHSRAPEAALCGLYLYFSCRDRAHEIAQSVDTPDGAFWHGIVHRQEPDPDNARYWFRSVGAHPVYPALGAAASQFPEIVSKMGNGWDPVRFVEICERARHKPDTPLARMAMEMQRSEWQLLFDYCAGKGRGAL